MKFHDRTDAGNQLAEALELSVAEESVVLALPRGGIPLGIIIAEKYSLPFDTIQSKNSVTRIIQSMPSVRYRRRGSLF